MATAVLIVLAHIPVKLPGSGLHDSWESISPSRFLANFLLIQNIARVRDISSPFWTLPVEVDMYLLPPLCFLVAQRSFRWMALLFAALVAAHFFCFSGIVPELSRLTVFHYGPCFFGGVLAYHLLRTHERPQLPAILLVPLLAAAIGLAVLTQAETHRYERSWIPCLFLGAMLPWIAELKSSMFTHAAKIVARYSYGIYLLHSLVLWFAFGAHADLPLAAKLAITFAGVILLPVAAYHAIERPSIQFGQALVRRRMPLAATQPAP